MKGQWFLISAVIAVGAFLAISIVMKGFFVTDASAPARQNADFYFWDVQNQFNATVQQSPCGPGDSTLNQNLQEFLSFFKKEMAQKGYFLYSTYSIVNCVDDNPSTPQNEKARDVRAGFLIASDNAIYYTSNVDPQSVLPGL